ncbi:MAG: DegT/DnrJ/EryC1/StrS family aminotransferase [Ignavibacteriales bacterium]
MIKNIQSKIKNLQIDNLRYDFDNLWIEEQEAIVARDYLLEGNSTEDHLALYQKQLGGYLNVEPQNILLFINAHSSLSFILKILKDNNPEKDVVILAGFTCSVVVNAITANQLTPVFSDIELDTYSLNADMLEKTVNMYKGRILAVITQHLFGIVARDYEKIMNICSSHQLTTIGDCAQSLGAFYNDRTVGLLEDYAIFSSQASKSINTYTGGMLLVNNRMFEKQIIANYCKLEFPENNFVKQILTAYYMQYRRKKFNSALALKLFLVHNRKKFIPSISPMEISDNRIDTLNPFPLENNQVYIYRYPDILAKIGLIQLGKIEQIISVRTGNLSLLEKSEGQKIRIIKNSRPSLLRYPFLRTESYKRNHHLHGNHLLGKWFPYYYGNCENAGVAARNLINYSVNIRDIK